MFRKQVFNKLSTLLLVITIAAIGLYLRLANLGYLSFWVDEFPHVDAAINLLEKGKPLLPSGFSYTRSLPFTALVAISFKFLGVSEFAARLPSIFFGAGIIPLSYVIGRRFFDRATGLVAATLLAFSPIAIAWSRECRMYSAFQFFFLLSIFILFIFLQKINLLPDVPLPTNGRKAAIKLQWLLMAVAMAFTLTISIQIIGYELWLIPFCYGLYGVALLFWRKGDQAVKTASMSKYAVLSSVSLISIIALMILKPLSSGLVPPGGAQVTMLYEGEISNLFKFAFNTDNIIWFLDQYGRWFSLMLLVIAALSITKVKAGAFPFIAYLSPLGFHILFTDETWGRYIFHLLPLYVLILSFGVVRLSRITGKLLAKSIDTRRASDTIAGYSAIVLTVGIIMLLVPIRGALTIPDLPHGSTPAIYHPNYRQAGEYIRNNMSEGDVVIALVPAAMEHYLGHADFALAASSYKVRSYKSSDGSIYDRYNGVRVITSERDLEKIMAKSKHGWLEATNDYFKSGLASAEMQDFILTKMRDRSADLDGTIRVFSWP